MRCAPQDALVNPVSCSKETLGIIATANSHAPLRFGVRMGRAEGAFPSLQIGLT